MLSIAGACIQSVLLAALTGSGWGSEEVSSVPCNLQFSVCVFTNSSVCVFMK